MLQLSSLMPFLTVAATSVVLMLLAAFYRNHFLAGLVSVAGLVITILSLYDIPYNLPEWSGKLIYVDNFVVFFILIVLLAALIINIVSIIYFSRFKGNKEEFYILFQVAVFGTLIMTASRNFAAFFLGLELLSIPLYVLIAYLRNNSGSVEAAIKYLILAAASSSVLLFGMALLFASTGSMDIITISNYLNITTNPPLLCAAGVAMIIIATGFKLSLAPFHMWAPDVYQGAPSPVAAFLGSIAKLGPFLLILFLFAGLNLEAARVIIIVLTVLSSLSMFIGNFLALKQTSLKRLLACSSIAHFGYLLISIIVGGKMGVAVSVFYLVVYFITTVGIFSIISFLTKDGKELDSIEEYKGLYFRNKWVAVSLAVMLFSLAGIPLTAGFISKIYLFTLGTSVGNWLLVWFLIINSALGLYYYLKIVFIMFSRPVGSQEKEPIWLPLGSSLVMAVLLIAVIWLGVIPEGVLNAIQAALK
jgi:NADH-quinone oxidoreductase subunit N